MEGCLGFGRRDGPDGFEQAAVVEPVHPVEGRIFDGFEAAPWATPMDNLGLEQPVDRFGQRVVIGIPDAADRGLDACFRKALNVAYGKILRPPVGVMYEARAP